MNQWIEKIKGNKVFTSFLLFLVGIILISLLWVVFHDSESVDHNVETRLNRIVSEIEGVGDLDLMVNEKDGEILGVIIVCEGADRFMVRLNVIRAVSTALGISQNLIQIYEKQ